MIKYATIRIAVIKLGLVIFLLLPLRHSTLLQALGEASHPQAISEPLVEIPRLRQLKAQLAKGDPSALGRFWEAMRAAVPPLRSGAGRCHHVCSPQLQRRVGLSAPVCAMLHGIAAMEMQRPLPDSNRGWRICNPLPYRLAKGPG